MNFYLKKALNEERPLLNSIVISFLITGVSAYYSLITVVVILSLFNIYGLYIFFKNVKQNLRRFRRLYYSNGQEKWDIEFFSRVKGVKTEIVTEWYKNGQIKCKYILTNEFSKVYSAKAFDKFGKKVQFDLSDSLYFKWYYSS
tara:strand:- start:299 stop:727 length:429 start_codon:yes stop_codon:yes gene_type:complete